MLVAAPVATERQIKKNGAKKMAKQGEKHHCAKVNDKIVEQIRREFKPHEMTIKMLSAKYGISKNTIKD